MYSWLKRLRNLHRWHHLRVLHFRKRRSIFNFSKHLLSQMHNWLKRLRNLHRWHYLRVLHFRKRCSIFNFTKYLLT
ncbi:unnamed protein product [Blepharisma stoltei]|uniref:Uncharacterized protein n=1 Tax=Blepharisma stoltei TaxID=1481888 RepID=A0AAU9J2Q0_9CILI|nr:unnamed protein product [Blepharisma stoltei]